MIIQQISVFLENRAGQLLDVTTALAENQIDMQAINIAETADYGIARLIVDTPKKAMEILQEKGFILRLTPVVQAAVPDRPGGLNELLAAVAEAGIDIEYMYSAFHGQKNGLAYMVFRVEDTQRLDKVLQGLA
ncbi:MAG: ACT domain-containing protein [Oscillospiraceae bacterium]|nr:ACT domain-containing protein [Oscillospiraceae bacterium]